MAREIGRLSAVKVKNAPPVMHGAGGGSWLHVNAAGARSWIFRYMLRSKAREMGLGPVHTIPLAEARKRAADCRRMRLDGIDPIEARRAGKANTQLEAAKAMIFEECARRYIEAHKAGWKSPKSLAAWEGTLAADVFPVFGKVAVQAIDTALVMKAIEPIWTKKPETAVRVRGRIEAILDCAAVRGWRPSGDNPARWRGHLDKMLPVKTKVRQVEHHLDRIIIAHRFANTMSEKPCRLVSNAESAAQLVRADSFLLDAIKRKARSYLCSGTCERSKIEPTRTVNLSLHAGQ